MNIKNIKSIIPHYVLRTDVSACECDLEANCDCMDDLVLYKDNMSGYGMARWVESDETCPADIDDYGRAYWCEFLGLPGFWACGEDDAAQRLNTILSNMGFPANVNYCFNYKAEKFMKENNL